MAYSSADIKNFVNGTGIGNNPWAMYSNAQKYGIGADQLDSAMGWNAGTSNNWIQQNGLNPLGNQNLGMGGGIMAASSSPGASSGGLDLQKWASDTGYKGDISLLDPVAIQASMNGKAAGNGGSVPPTPPGGLLANSGFMGGTKDGAIGNWSDWQSKQQPAGNSDWLNNGYLQNNTNTGNRTQYGYNQNPTQNSYYQQDTPLGSFAGASTNQANTYQASNPYIGQTSQGIAGVGNVGTATAGANPYIGQTTQGVNYQAAQGAGANPYAGSNPYLNQAIDANAADMQKNFNQSVMPQIDRMAQQSGSFGNTGVQAVQQNAMSDLGKNIGQMSNSMRMQDYGMQQGLAENQLNRNQALNTFNAGNAFQGQQFNSGLQAGDLSRNLGATSQVGMFNAGQQNNMGQFNANNLLNSQQFNSTLGSNDLSRNASLAQNLGQFNAGARNNVSQFNAGQGNSMNQFNAGSANQMIQNQLNRNQAMNQFDQNMDFNVWNQNNQNMRQGTQDQISLLNNLLKWQGLGTGAATNVQNTPLNYWQQFAQGAGNLGGVGGTIDQTGTDSKNYPGNPLLGGIGGYQLWNALFGGGK